MLNCDRAEIKGENQRILYKKKEPLLIKREAVRKTDLSIYFKN